MRPQACRASETGHRLSARPGCVERGEGLPGAWAVLFVRAMVEHPAGYGPLLAHLTQRSLVPSENPASWASGKVRGFGAAYPMARTFACLRIAAAISGTVARLATGPGGLTLGRTGFAPAGRRTKFHEGITPPIPFDQPCLVALNFLLCCRCCQALLRIFFCILWALYYLAPSGLTASLGVGTSWSNDLLIVRV